MKSALAPLASALKAPPPWLAPYAHRAQQILDAADSQSVAAALNTVRIETITPVRFVDHSLLLNGESYESFIARTASVPTRDNLHEIGQVYVPSVNWVLFAGTLTLVLAYRSSSALAGAYGIAIASTMKYP